VSEQNCTIGIASFFLLGLSIRLEADELPSMPEPKANAIQPWQPSDHKFHNKEAKWTHTVEMLTWGPGYGLDVQ
jgi:hypothetical protein